MKPIPRTTIPPPIVPPSTVPLPTLLLPDLLLPDVLLPDVLLSTSLLPTGRLIAIAARNSGQQGKNARYLVAVECHEAAKDLLRHMGIDVRHLIPSVPDLIEMLKTRAVRKTSHDSKTGKKFVNEYLTLHLTPQLVLLVSTGSGHKFDEDLAQPFLGWLNGELKSLRPGMLVWHRIDRVFRTPLLGANTLHLCEELDIQIVDGEKGPFNGGMDALFALWRARESSEEASRIPKKTRDGQTSRTGTDMSSGSMPYALAMPPPPGMMVVRMKAPNGGLGDGWLFFDTPPPPPDPNADPPPPDPDADEKRHYPAAGDVAVGLPDVRVDGVLVNQVANVRFALSKLGTPGWDINKVASALGERGFSTQSLRKENTPQTAFTSEHCKGALGRALRPIVERLDFYRTGVLEVKFGVEDVEDFNIINCFPPDGPWATQEDFARIVKFLLNTTGGGPASQGLTGVTVRTEAGSLPLRSAPPGRRVGGPAYVTRPAESGLAIAAYLPPLPHAELAASIVDALVANAERLLTPLVQQELPEAEALRVELHAAEHLAATLQQRCNTMLDSLGVTGADGLPLISGDAVQGVSTRYNTLVKKELQPATAEVLRLQTKLAELARLTVGKNPAIHTALLLRMVDSLRDPFDTTYNDLWKGAVRIEKVTTTPITVHETAGTITRWEGTIRTAGADQEFSAPFHGEYLYGAAADLPAKVDDTLEMLLEGVPFSAITQTNARGVRLALAERLGFDSRYFGLPVCPDPRLVKIAAHLAVDPVRDTARVAGLLGEPIELVHDVLTQLTSGRPTWGSLIATLDITEAA